MDWGSSHLARFLCFDSFITVLGQMRALHYSLCGSDRNMTVVPLVWQIYRVSHHRQSLPGSSVCGVLSRPRSRPRTLPGASLPTARLQVFYYGLRIHCSGQGSSKFVTWRISMIFKLCDPQPFIGHSRVFLLTFLSASSFSPTLVRAFSLCHCSINQITY